MQPKAYVFSGANASGKSTLITFLLENKIINGIYINADLILKEELNLEEAKENYIKAFRVEAKKIEENIQNKNNIILEVVTSKNTIYKLKKQGYYVTYVFVGTVTPKINAIYLAQRVSEGGHDVLMRDLIRRWQQSLDNLQEVKNIVDCLILIDNSKILQAPALLKSYFQGQLCYINNEINLSKIKWISALNNKKDFIEGNLLDNKAYQFCQFIRENLKNYTATLGKNYKEKNQILYSYSKDDTNQLVPQQPKSQKLKL